MKVTYAPFDPADYLDNDEIIAEYLTAAAEDPNPAVFLAALGNVAKAKGMAQIAKDAGLGRESLYKTFGTGAHPRYETVSAVLRAVGVKLTVVVEKRRPTRSKLHERELRQANHGSVGGLPVQAGKIGFRSYPPGNSFVHLVQCPGADGMRTAGRPAVQDSAVVERDEDGWYVASVPTLPGCHTQARSLDELMIRIREAIEACLEAGDTPTPLEFVGIQRVSMAA